MHTLLVVEIIFYAIALLVFIACYATLIKKGVAMVVNRGFINVVFLFH